MPVGAVPEGSCGSRSDSVCSAEEAEKQANQSAGSEKSFNTKLKEAEQKD